MAPDLGVEVPGLALGGRDVLGRLSLRFRAGEVTALLGPSGVGKSTLLRLVAGLLPLPAGARLTPGDGLPLAQRIAWMGQQDLLLPWLDLLGNVTLGARLRGTRPDAARARALIAAVGLAGREGARPAALSGGMRQRAALARTLMEDRPFVLMDEPFSAVDAPTRHRLQDLASGLLAGRTVLLVTHDPLEALRLAHRILVLRPAPGGAVPEELAMPPAPPLRAARDPAVLAAQAALLERLAEAA
ncbi:ATP-binding cassette domain-containing protein [Roseomonas sp. GC11]|uniref:ATP-binding cassette domain-containing protein n=1 Tax=Roseomonas sp. GC11 TaxID=2950546 RepID=UPI002108BDD7|nr:ATP-binding cassette domain-containing protein [Roseomonas sp. GC11]MCQ4162003.1 ATP-binding cassette domain-containing protein [Roseomonas sp. GC11]